MKKRLARVNVNSCRKGGLSRDNSLTNCQGCSHPPGCTYTYIDFPLDTIHPSLSLSLATKEHDRERGGCQASILLSINSRIHIRQSLSAFLWGCSLPTAWYDKRWLASYRKAKVIDAYPSSLPHPTFSPTRRHPPLEHAQCFMRTISYVWY